MTTRKSWLAMVLEVDADHFDASDAYVFSNGRVFKDTDRSGGIYNLSFQYRVTQEGDYRVTQDGSKRVWW